MDPLLILLFGLLAVMIFFTWRNSKKRKAEAEEMQNKLLPGAEIMTQHGIFGTLVSIDDDTNQAIIETTPGVLVRVHRQTLARVVEPELETADEETASDDEDPAAPTTEPEFGERAEKPKRAPRRKASDASSSETAE